MTSVSQVQQQRESKHKREAVAPPSPGRWLTGRNSKSSLALMQPYWRSAAVRVAAPSDLAETQAAFKKLSVLAEMILKKMKTNTT